MRTSASPEIFAARHRHLVEAMLRRGIDAAILWSGSEMLWLAGCGFDLPDSHNVLVVQPSRPQPTLLVSSLEVLNVRDRAEFMDIVEIGGGVTLRTALNSLFTGRPKAAVAVSDMMPAHLLLPLQAWHPGTRWIGAASTFNQLRRTKDKAEIEALRRVARATDQVVLALQTGAVPFRGRTERAVAKDVERLFHETGHDRVDFVIVAFGPNAASPHHEPDDTVIGDGILLFDIGGTIDGYHSDTTRCIHVGQPKPEVFLAYETLRLAQESAVQAVRPGISASELDDVAKRIIGGRGYVAGRYTHGLGHGIGLDCHEAPRVSARSTDVLQVGDVISVEPGIYFEGQWGMRLEDIVVVTEDGREILNRTTHDLVVVEV